MNNSKFGRIMIGVCVVECAKCEDRCTCGTAKAPHFKSLQHEQSHQRFVKNIFALLE